MLKPLNHSDETVLITGASSGIGLELARQLARKGSDLVLVARRDDRLQVLAGELRDQLSVGVHVVTADLSLPAAGRRLLEEVRGDASTSRAS